MFATNNNTKNPCSKTQSQLESDVRYLQGTIAELKRDCVKLDAKNKALLIERSFWVQQGRELQNQLQTWQSMYADMFDQLGRGVVTETTIADNLAMATEELRQPIAAIEAVNAAFALLKENTQGAYTSVTGRKTATESLLDWGDDNDDTP